jgi:hypothetical protein
MRSWWQLPAAGVIAFAATSCGSEETAGTTLDDLQGVWLLS